VRYSILSEATFVYCEKMDKKQFCVLIKHCFLAKKILLKAWLDKHYSDSVPVGKMSIEDDARSGHLKETVTDENIKKVHKIILNDRKMELIDITETLKISKERVGYIIHAYLDMRKLCAKCRACSQSIKINNANVLMIWSNV
jgi:hypothetical protein